MKPVKMVSRGLPVAVLAVGCLLVGSVPAVAATTSPWWGVTGASRPSQLTQNAKGEIAFSAQNLGDADTKGKITINAALPPGVEAIGMTASAGENGAHNLGPVACAAKTLTCTFEKTVPAYEGLEVRIAVLVGAGANNSEQYSATVSGGGAAHPVSVTRDLQIGGAEKFGVDDYQLIPETFSGGIDTQAGSHPYQLTSVVTLNSQTPDQTGRPRTAGLPKDIAAELPVGLIGNPTPFTQCTDAQFAKQETGAAETAGVLANQCPAQSAIGVATVTYTEPALEGFNTATAPIFTMTPRPGEPARFGFKVQGIVAAFLDVSLRTGSDYGVTVTSSNITQLAWLLGVKLTFWGVPGDPRHDGQRGWECLKNFGSCPASTNRTPPPFLVLPTSCEAPYETTIHADSWDSFEHPAEQAEPVFYKLPLALDGCNKLPFAPSIRVTPDGTAASTPTGLNVDVHVPQDAVLNGESLAESNVRDITVALPEGVAVNPAGADGLEACTETQVGYRAGESTSEQKLFTSTLPQPFCPDASKIGTVDISSPLLPASQHVKGAVYLASQQENPFGSLLAMYIVAEDRISGTLIKLTGEVKLSPTGQIVTTFKHAPQLAFEDAELHFFGGDRAPLATPDHCGTYTTSASFAPWSGNEPVSASTHFDIDKGPNNAPCPGQTLPFAPSLTAGTTSIQAGGFSPFTMTMSREDGQQSLQAISLHMPPGLSGLLTGVKLCGQAQANAGTCGSESEIGETTVSVGLGGDPFSVKGGKVFITEGYEGAPYGLSIVNPAKAGPFDLENTPTSHPPCDCIVVRAKIEVDPITAQLTITSDNTGPYKIPTMIEGIPLQIKHVNVTIDRPNFTFNPTNCNPMNITGALSSTEGATLALSVPLQVTNCAVLGFKPGFKVSTAGKTSRANGASLSVKLTYPKAPFGSQANIKSVKVDLPRQLPSRLTTLQQACTLAQFQANPAGCPAASIVGHAKAITPLIPVALEGPAYFVSNAGLKFPELVVVLQGYGVTLDLHGETFISKAGITSSTFKTVPDAPVGSFELALPQGKYSALAANGNLCNVKGGLKMPTQFVAQNGAIIKQSTPIAVTGCPKHAVKKKAKKASRGHKQRGKH